MYYILLVIWSVLESTLASANLFGWPQFLEILEGERYFSSYCNHDTSNVSVASSSNVSSNDNDVLHTCVRQDSLLNLAYTLATFSIFFSSFIGGRILDIYGFRKTRLLSSFIYLLAGLFMYISTNGMHEFLFPGVVLTSCAGGFNISILIKVCGIIPKRQSTAVSFINGGIDSSSVILLVFMLSYNAGMSFKDIIIVYYSLVLLNGLLLTFTIFPKDIPRNSEQETVMITNFNADTLTSKRPHESGLDKSETLLGDEPIKSKENDKVVAKKDEAKPINVTVYSSEGNVGLLSYMKGIKFVSLTCFVSITCLRSITVAAMTNKLLKRLSQDEEEVDLYLTILGGFQFCGLVVAFLPALILDWKPRGKPANFSTVLGFIITGLISILVTVFFLIPILELQILTFLLYILMKSFLYSSHGSMIIKEFPLQHTGALFGSSILVTSFLSLLQIPMFALMEGPYKGDPTLVNVGILVFQVIVLLHPLYLWKHSNKEKKQGTAKTEININPANTNEINV